MNSSTVRRGGALVIFVTTTLLAAHVQQRPKWVWLVGLLGAATAYLA